MAGEKSLTDSIFGSHAPTAAASSCSALFGDDGDSSKIDAAIEARRDRNTAKRLKTSSDAAAEAEKHKLIATTSPEDTIARRKKQAANPVIQSFTLVRENDVSQEAFAGEVSSIIRAYGLAVIKNAMVSAADNTVLDALHEAALRCQTSICSELAKRGLTWNDERNNKEQVRFREVVVRCKGRMDVRYDTKGDAKSFLNDATTSLLNSIVQTVLFGDEHSPPQLIYAGWIFSYPDSADQPWHQDGVPLFPGTNGSNIAATLPPYAINIFIPLEDAALEMGPTDFVVASHRAGADAAMEAATKDGGMIASPLLQRGDLLLYDYRICHRGTANLTNTMTPQCSKGRVRTVLYLMYARPWFKEHVNFGQDKLFATTPQE